MTLILNLNIGGLNCRMTLKERSHQVSIPWPVVLRVAGRMYAGKAAAGLNVMLDRALLAVVKEIARGVQEDYGFVLRQVLVGKDSRILTGIHSKLIVPA